MKSKSLKRWLSVCLAATAIMVMTAGCQGKEEAPADGGASAAQSETRRLQTQRMRRIRRIRRPAARTGRQSLEKYPTI